MPDQIELLEIDDWKKRAESTTVADEQFALVAPMKYRLCEVKAVADQERVLEFIISDGGIDRSRDVINPKGWDLKHWKMNPVVLWAHENWGPPVGRGVKIWREDGEELAPLMSRAEFTPADLNPFGDFVYRMLLGKFLRATSVGFKPKAWDWAPDSDGEERRGGINFGKQELIEWSIVPIGDNPRALQRGAKALPLGMDLMAAHAAGVDTAPLRVWCEKKLDRAEPLKGLAPSDVEDAWKAVSPRKLIVDMGMVAKGWAAESPVFEAPAPEPAPGVPKLTEVDEVQTEQIRAAYREWRVATGCPQGKDFGAHLAALVVKAAETEKMLELRVQERVARSLCSPMTDDLIKALEPAIMRDPTGGWIVKRGAIAVARTKDPGSIRFHEDGSIFLDPEPSKTKTVVVDPEEIEDDYVLELAPTPAPAPEPPKGFTLDEIAGLLRP